MSNKSLKIIIPLCFLFLLQACSISNFNKEQVLSSLSSKEKTRVMSGQIMLGDTLEVVEVAKGKPDKVLKFKEYDVDYIEWHYQKKVDDFSFPKINSDMSIDENAKIENDKKIKKSYLVVRFKEGKVFNILEQQIQV